MIQDYKQKWEKSQAILHTDTKEKAETANSYGIIKYKGYGQNNTLYSRKELRPPAARDRLDGGFVFEAFEAPGSRIHTQQEKHLDLSRLKQAGLKTDRHLYTSELPLRGQAIYYALSSGETCRKSSYFIRCLKTLLAEYHHPSLRDAFGFLEQEPDRLQLQALVKQRREALTPQQYGHVNHQSDTLGSRLLRKEAKERQLCSDLQLMISRHKQSGIQNKSPYTDASMTSRSSHTGGQKESLTQHTVRRTFRQLVSGHPARTAPEEPPDPERTDHKTEDPAVLD